MGIRDLHYNVIAKMKTLGFVYDYSEKDEAQERHFRLTYNLVQGSSRLRGSGLSGGRIALDRIMNVRVQYKGKKGPERDLNILEDQENIIKALEGTNNIYFFQSGEESNPFSDEVIMIVQYRMQDQVTNSGG